MPYPRYSGSGGGNNYNSGSGRRDDYRGSNRGYGNSHGSGMVSPWQGGPPGGLLPTPSGSGSGGNLALALGSLLSGSPGSGGNVANLASQLNLAQALAGSVSSGSGSSFYGNNSSGGGGGGYGGGGMRRDSRYRHDKSPPRRGYRRSRSRSPPRRPRYDDRGNAGRPHKRHRDSSPVKERPEHEIYIGNYPVKFREEDLKALFVEHNITVKSIRMKHDGLKVFAFAETENKEEIEKAVDAMDSMEINGRRLRVRSAGDKEPRGPNPKHVRRELTVNDVKNHLVYAFNGFLDREMNIEGLDEKKVEDMKTVQTLLASIFELPDDDSLKVSRDLELIFMQNNRREIKVTEPEKPKSEKDTVPSVDVIATTDESKVELDSQEVDDGNWKRRKVANDDDEEEEEGDPEEATGEEEMTNEASTQEQNEEDISENVEEDINENVEEDVTEDVEESIDEDAEDISKAIEEEQVDEEDEDVSSAIAESTDELEAEMFPPPPVVTPPTRGGRGRGRGRRGRGKRN